MSQCFLAFEKVVADQTSYDERGGNKGFTFTLEEDVLFNDIGIPNYNTPLRASCPLTSSQIRLDKTDEEDKTPSAVRSED